MGNISSSSMYYPAEAAPYPGFEMRSIETLAGYVAQVRHQGSLVWESAPKKTREKAETTARRHITNKLKELFQ